MPAELPEEAVGQGNKQKNATGGNAEKDLGRQGERALEGHQPTGGGGQRERGQPQPSDPNREPGGNALYNEDKQGGVFYDKNTEIKRETEFHDATAAPLGDEEQKVTPDNDQFGK